MEIISSFCINKQIKNISLDTVETKLIQNIKYDQSKNAIVHSVTMAMVFDLSDPDIKRRGNVIFVDKPDYNIEQAYIINENNSISRVSHLSITLIDGTFVFIVNESIESYYNILTSIPHEFIYGVFVNVSGTIRRFDLIPWDKTDNNITIAEGFFAKMTPSTKP